MKRVCQKTDLLLSIVEFVCSLHSRVKDGLRGPQLDLYQAHVDPEESRSSQRLGVLIFASDVLLQTDTEGLRHAIRQQTCSWKLSENLLDLLRSTHRARALHQAPAGLHVALLKAHRQQAAQALKLPKQNCSLQLQV